MEVLHVNLRKGEGGASGREITHKKWKSKENFAREKKMGRRRKRMGWRWWWRRRRGWIEEGRRGIRTEEDIAPSSPPPTTTVETLETKCSSQQSFLPLSLHLHAGNGRGHISPPFKKTLLLFPFLGRSAERWRQSQGEREGEGIESSNFTPPPFRARLRPLSSFFSRRLSTASFASFGER